MRIAMIVLIAALLSSCSWVEPTTQGKTVLLVAPIHVQNCQYLGQSQSITKANLGPIQRNADTIELELITLARNQAAKMGGDSMVMTVPPKEGQATFAVYRCKQP